MSPLLLLLIFVLELSILLINAIGASRINDLIWTILSRLPLESSKLAAQNRKLQKDYLKVRLELNATSSQDEFARWAILRRQHDKLLEALEQKKKEMAAQRTNFDRTINGARLVLTKAPQYIIPFWYAKEPMFWLPQGLFPHYAEWFLSLPKAPLGSVSIMSWQVACAAILSLLFELVGSLWVLATTAKTPAKGAPMKMPGRTESETTANASVTTGRTQEKEL